MLGMGERTGGGQQRGEQHVQQQQAGLQHVLQLWGRLAGLHVQRVELGLEVELLRAVVTPSGGEL